MCIWNYDSVALLSDLEISKPNKTFDFSFRESPGESDLEKLEEFRSLIKVFLGKYAPKKLYVPPSTAAIPVGGQRYNDAGTVKKDSEKPEFSWNSGFLFQEFLTGPLTPREVWLPGKLFKACNAWWFAFVQPLMRKIPYNAHLPPKGDAYREDDSRQLWERIKERLNGHVTKFDVSGFGLQYPRSYLSVIVEEIVLMYPDSEVEEQGRTLLEYLKKVVLERDGKFYYPTRGIGLGYLEDLKTIGIMAIIDRYDPISVYGDQGLLTHKRSNAVDPVNRRRVKMTTPYQILELKSFGFLFEKSNKIKGSLVHTKIGTRGHLWGGALMGTTMYSSRKTVFSDISGALSKKFHWERKSSLRGVILDPSYQHIWRRITLHYELYFGSEFFRGESFAHPENLGVNPLATLKVGYLKDWKVAKMPDPSSRWEDNVLFQTPFTESKVSHGEAKQFSKLRAETYKKSGKFCTLQRDYVYPMIEMNEKKRVILPEEAAATPLWMDWRSLILEGSTSGRIASGLQEEDIMVAPHRQRYARDPYAARASGGYKITTMTHGSRGPDQELEELSYLLANSTDIASNYVFRRDTKEALPASMGWREPYLDRDLLMEREKNPYIKFGLHKARRDVESQEHAQEEPSFTVSGEEDLEDDLFQDLDEEWGNPLPDGAIIENLMESELFEDTNQEFGVGYPDVHTGNDDGVFYEDALVDGDIDLTLDLYLDSEEVQYEPSPKWKM